MTGKWYRKYFALIVVFLMVFSMLSPLSAQATDLKQPNFDESIMQQKAAIAEQLRVHTGQAVLHKDLQNLSGSEEVNVIIHLSEKPVALEKGISDLKGRSFNSNSKANIKAKVNKQQSEVKGKMKEKKVSFKEGYAFDTVLNGNACLQSEYQSNPHRISFEFREKGLIVFYLNLCH